jgi:hypothetical protein
MQTWECDVIYVDPNDLHQKQNEMPLLTRTLNRRGQQGWEALTAILFKRPCQAPPTPGDLADSAHDAGVTGER